MTDFAVFIPTVGPALPRVQLRGGGGESETLTRNRSRWRGHYGWGTQREPERKEGFPGHESRVHRAGQGGRKALGEDHSHMEEAPDPQAGQMQSPCACRWLTFAQGLLITSPEERTDSTDSHIDRTRLVSSD